MLNGALVTEAIARILAVDHADLDRLALAAPSGSGGLVLVPYLAGERTPNRPDATGTLSGIRTDLTRERLARAAFEGVVCSLLDGLDALATAGVATGGGRMVLLGGGARSAGYRHVLASLSGRPVTVPTDGELVSAGAALPSRRPAHPFGSRGHGRRLGAPPGQRDRPGPRRGLLRPGPAEVRRGQGLTGRVHPQPTGSDRAPARATDR